MTLLQTQTIMIETQAKFVGLLNQLDARLARVESQIAETNRLNSERFARIEVMLAEHSRIIRGHPESARGRNGFKGPQQP